jgi:hypothetical protein
MIDTSDHRVAGSSPAGRKLLYASILSCEIPPLKRLV